MFSYAEGNHLCLNDQAITQLTAPNGSGKTSLALIIQELLYSKNIKGIKKGDIKNRYLPSDEWSGEISFTDSINNNNYLIKVNRKNNTSKVFLYENEIDISEHKIPDTYKKIKEITKLDFEIFSQLTYQSSVDLLHFLKATDTNRKKFLINLFNLEKYLDYGDLIKIRLTESEKELTSLNGELRGIESFLAETTIPEKNDYKDELPFEDEWVTIRDNLVIEKHNYEELCKKIDQNNLYFQESEKLEFDISMEKPTIFEKSDLYSNIMQEIISISVDLRNDTVSLKTLDTSDECPTCGQPIDNTQALKMEKELKIRLKDNEEKKDLLNKELESLDKEKEQIENHIQTYNKNMKTIERFEQLSQLINKNIPTEYPDIDKIENDLQKINNKIESVSKENEIIRKHNNSVREHNTKVDALIEQKEQFENKQTVLINTITQVKNKLKYLNILKKAFSPTGLVAFKLENLTKNLEETINYYLSELSDGIFQVVFRLTGEKLNIVIIQNGKESPIENVSGGEFGRIQTAILLAIRSVLSDIGGNSVNLLFLDEISGTLDESGKEKLIEVLQDEKDLNVFLISHDFTHPLIEKIPITKENNISQIEH